MYRMLLIRLKLEQKQLEKARTRAGQARDDTSLMSTVVPFFCLAKSSCAFLRASLGAIP